MMARINVDELKRIIGSTEDYILIDVREPYEHEEFNIGGRNLPMGDIMNWLPEFNTNGQTHAILYCKSGNRSMMVTAFLKYKGIANVSSLSGGLKAWKASVENQ